MATSAYRFPGADQEPLPSGSPQDDKHFSTSDESIKVPENLNLCLLSSADDSPEQTCRLQGVVTKGFLVIRRLAESIGAQVLIGHTGHSLGISIRISRLDANQVLDPNSMVEFA